MNEKSNDGPSWTTVWLSSIWIALITISFISITHYKRVETKLDTLIQIETLILDKGNDTNNK